MPNYETLALLTTLIRTEQYALTEASYTLVKLAQKFQTVECADPEIQVPKIHSTLTMSHDRGVKVRLS